MNLNVIIKETILETKDIKVRVIEIFKNTITPWHHHSYITDNCFCLTGEIKVHTKNPNRTVILKPGERCTIGIGIIHSVENSTSSQAKYLLVQGTGEYDFIESKL